MPFKAGLAAMKPLTASFMLAPAVLVVTPSPFNAFWYSTMRSVFSTRPVFTVFQAVMPALPNVAYRPIAA